MKTLPGLLSILWLCTSLSVFAQNASQEIESDDALELQLFEAYLDGVLSAQFEDYALAGMTFTMIKNGQPYLSKGYGYAHLESRQRVDPSRHLFRPGSVSKLFTWTAVMQLMEQGLLDLDADVNQYLTQFILPDNFDKPITLKHIMTHAAGFEDGAMGYLFANSATDLRPLAEVLADYIPEQVREPGTYSAYSNYATAVAGLIVANVSGMSFEEYVAEHIFAPLGMTQSTFDEPLPQRLTTDMATGYADKSGGLESANFEYIKNFGPAGALSASADDMAKFMLAHVNDGSYNGNRILQEETARLMHSRLFAHHASISGMTYGFFEIHRNNERFIGHGGDTIAFHSQLIIHPEDDFGFYLSFNSPEGAQARGAVVNAIIDYFYPGEDPGFVYPALEGSADRIANIVGAYRVNRRSYTKLEGVTAMFSDITGSSGEDGEIVSALGRYFEIEPYVFQEQGSHERVVFETDQQGNVNRAFLGSVPIIVLDKVPFLEQGGVHQLVILLALLAALFVVINALRNRRALPPEGAALLARRSLVGASTLLLLFVASIAVIMSVNPTDELIYNFPPTGTGIILLMPLLFSLLAIMCLGLMVPVWRSADCNIWQRIRFTYVGVVFVALVFVLNYWNILGWNYY